MEFHNTHNEINWKITLAEETVLTEKYGNICKERRISCSHMATASEIFICSA